METLQQQLMQALLDHLRSSYLRFQVATLDDSDYYFHLNFDQILALQFIPVEGDGAFMVEIMYLTAPEDIGTGLFRGLDKCEVAILAGNDVRAFIHHVAGLLEASGRIWLEAKGLVTASDTPVNSAPAEAPVAAPTPAAKPQVKTPAPQKTAAPTSTADDFDDIPF